MGRSFFTVAIGASTGGLPALIEFFDHISNNPRVAFVVVMHLIRDKRSLLNTILCKHTSLPMIRVEKDTLLEAGKVYLIIENTTLRIKDGYLRVEQRDKGLINSSVNSLFESLAIDFKEWAIGIVLSGAGDDGLQGAKKIKEMGGSIMVQDPGSAEMIGMPSSVIRGDHPVAILKPAELAKQVIRFCMDNA